MKAPLKSGWQNLVERATSIHGDRTGTWEEPERALLGSMMISPKMASMMRSRLKPEQFGSPTHGKVFQAICDLVDTGIEPDLVTVKANLTEKGELASVGGIDNLTQMTFLTPSANAGPSYADQVVRAWRGRELMRRHAEGLALVAQGSLDAALEAASQVGHGLTDEGTFEFDAGDVVDALDSDIAAGIQTGFDCVDSHCLGGGLYRGEPCYIAALEGVGKSAIALQIVVKACQSAKRVVFYSGEMDTKQVLRRAMYQLTGFWSRQAAFRAHCEEDWDRAVFDVKAWDLRFYDTSTAPDDAHTVEAFSDWVLLKHAAQPIDLIVVDYLQLLESRRDYREERLTLKRVERVIRALARRTGAAMLCLSQVTESADLKGRTLLSGSREMQKGAALVLALVEDEDGYLLRCAKNRHGLKKWQRRLTLDQLRLLFQEFTPHEIPVYRGDAEEARGGAA